MEMKFAIGHFSTPIDTKLISDDMENNSYEMNVIAKYFELCKNINND